MKYKADRLTLLMLALYTIIRICAFEQASNYPWLIAMMIPGIILLANTIKHNHVHLPIFRKKGANLIIDQWLNFLTGTSTSSVRIIHVINHHDHVDGDHDWTSTKKKKTDLGSFLLYMIQTPFNLVKQKNQWLEIHKASSLKNYLLLENILILALLLLLVWINIYATIISFIIPTILSQLFLIGFNYIQHINCDHDSEFSHSNNFTGSLFNLLTFNAGFHTAHHNEPALHWSALRNYHKTISDKIPLQHLIPNFLTSLMQLARSWSSVSEKKQINNYEAKNV